MDTVEALSDIFVELIQEKNRMREAFPAVEHWAKFAEGREDDPFVAPFVPNLRKDPAVKVYINLSHMVEKARTAL